MADSKRLQIQKALTTLLETITVANGYNHDMAGKVSRGRMVMDANDINLVPLLSLLEAPREGAADYPDHGNSAVMLWELYISGWLKADALAPTDACHALLADVKRCLAAVRRNVQPHEQTAGNYPNALLGGLISKLEISGGICRPPRRQELRHQLFFTTPESDLY